MQAGNHGTKFRRNAMLQVGPLGRKISIPSNFLGSQPSTRSKGVLSSGMRR
jgi:hypothetical protein